MQNAKKASILYIFLQKVEFVRKRFSPTQNPERFSDFPRNLLFDTSDFTIAVQESLSPLWPLFAGEHFGAQNAFWGPKVHFGPQNAFSGPAMHFGVIFAPWPEMLMKPMVSASDFTLFGVEMRKLALFRTLGLRNAK